MSSLVQIIGLISAALTTAAFLPQTIKTWKTRSTSDLSPLMFALFCIGILGWLVYGIMSDDLPIILANAVTICLAGTIMYFIIVGKKSAEISHLALFVDDIEKMKLFYCSFFSATAGKKYSNADSGFSSYFLSFQSGAKLELMHQKKSENKNKSNHGHFAISVGNRKMVDKLTEELSLKNIEVISAPRLTGDGYYESVIADPEGNRIEITV